jgi:hypothetical protein
MCIQFLDEITVLPKDNFSPESGGNVNPSTAIEAIKTQGTIKLKK